MYIKVLEQRVAELEAYLASIGHMGVGTDHISRLAQASAASQQQAIVPSSQSGQTTQPAQQVSDDDGNDLLVAVRDLSLSKMHRIS